MRSLPHLRLRGHVSHSNMFSQCSINVLKILYLGLAERCRRYDVGTHDLEAYIGTHTGTVLVAPRADNAQNHMLAPRKMASRLRVMITIVQACAEGAPRVNTNLRLTRLSCKSDTENGRLPSLSSHAEINRLLERHPSFRLQPST